MAGVNVSQHSRIIHVILCFCVDFIPSVRVHAGVVPTVQCPPPLVCNATLPSPEPPRIIRAVNNEARPETFSELTLFLFGSGVALFVALLGWSDQIRGINKDTREIEKRFLETTKINRTVFLSVVKPTSPDDQLAALTEILVSGKAQNVAAVEVLKIFQTWHRKWAVMEALALWKYRLAVVLTYSLFAAGLLSLLVNPHQVLLLRHLQVRALLLILVVPMAGFLAILTIIAVANYKEFYFHELLNSLSEKV